MSGLTDDSQELCPQLRNRTTQHHTISEVTITGMDKKSIFIESGEKNLAGKLFME
jgi:hypothetical protein